ncbi:hypothetical protein [Lewinella sp. JB7]|uniref:hypothetical protein n=1 Tax=Lewinella sp. JB7 TaxID=2962887 RepID=UPI0020C98D05|nr:hypothetical protein [Lewinella sp. JB7]MCP9237465.1 hypothetical protein [Lewinella sp. JB7]
MPYVHLTEVLDLQTLTVIKLSLDREGLEYRVLFEYSLHVGAYLLGNRGAVIEVRAEDRAAAADLLRAEGIPVDESTVTYTFGRLQELELLTEILPLVGRWSASLRLLFLTLVLAGTIAVVIYYVALG